MSLTRIKGLALQDFYITRRETTVWVDLVFFSLINITVFGYIARYLSGDNPAHGRTLLVGMMMWEVVRLCQYTVTLNSLWNAWSHNLSNLFIAPVSIVEYSVGNMITAVIKTLAIFTPISVVTWMVFDFNILSVGILNLSLAIIALMLFACAVGLVLLGFVFRYGLRVQAVSWSAVYLFQPLMGAYFPPDILPAPLRALSSIIPATYAFEGIHNAVDGSGATISLQLISLASSAVALVLGLKVFSNFYMKSKISGQFARNDAG